MKQFTHCRAPVRAERISDAILAPLLHHEPSALLGVEMERTHRGGLGTGLIIGDDVPQISGAHVPEILAAVSDQRHAPATDGRILLGLRHLRNSDAMMIAWLDNTGDDALSRVH